MSTKNDFIQEQIVLELPIPQLLLPQIQNKETKQQTNILDSGELFSESIVDHNILG